MKKFPILYILGALLSLFFVSEGFVEPALGKSTEKKGKIVKKVKSLDLAPPSSSADDGSGWKMISADLTGTINSFSFIVYFFREFDNFTCRVYKVKSGKAAGKPVSLPKKALGVGYHKFNAKARVTFRRPIGICRESDRMPRTLDELKVADKSPVAPALTIDEYGPVDTTQQDRDRGWKLVEAVGIGRDSPSVSSTSNDPIEFEYTGNTTADALSGTAAGLDSLLSLISSVAAAKVKSTVVSKVYFYEPVQILACQLYYIGNKKKKYGKKVGVLKTLPNEKTQGTGLAEGLLSFNVKGPAKDKVRPMRLVCSEDKEALPKKLTSEVPEGLHAIDIVTP